MESQKYKDAEKDFQFVLKYVPSYDRDRGFNLREHLGKKHVEYVKRAKGETTSLTATDSFDRDVKDYIAHTNIKDKEYLRMLDDVTKAHNKVESCLKTGGKSFKFPRRFTRKHCARKPCKRMGFTEKASCRPYKNCYRK